MLLIHVPLGRSEENVFLSSLDRAENIRRGFKKVPLKT